MEQKPVSFIEAGLAYIIAVFALLVCPNAFILYFRKSLQDMIFLYIYSVGLPMGLAFALLFLIKTRRAGRFDKVIALIALGCVSVASLRLGAEFYTLMVLGEFSRFISTNICEYPCLRLALNLWAIAICLGACLGMVVLSAGALLRQPQAPDVKAKNSPRPTFPNFRHSSIRYILIALLLGWIPNTLVFLISDQISYPAGFVFSLSSYSLIAFHLRHTRFEDTDDRGVAVIGLVLACVFLSSLIVIFYDLSDTLQNPYIPRDSGDYEQFKTRFIMISMVLGFFWGFTALSGHTLIRHFRIVGKPKNTDL